MGLIGDGGSVGLAFLLGWGVTVTAGLMSYPIDTIRRRMMMTSGGGVKYNGSLDCAKQIMAKEGFMSMMKGAFANVLRVLPSLVSSLDLTSSSLCTLHGEHPCKFLLYLHHLASILVLKKLGDFNNFSPTDRNV